MGLFPHLQLSLPAGPLPGVRRAHRQEDLRPEGGEAEAVAAAQARDAEGGQGGAGREHITAFQNQKYR